LYEQMKNKHNVKTEDLYIRSSRCCMPPPEAISTGRKEAQLSDVRRQYSEENKESNAAN